jgi:hypothetical protein
MLQRKVSIYAIMLIVFAACSKENTTVPAVQANEANSNVEWRWPFPRGGGDTELVTTFGLINERSNELSPQEDIDLTQDQMDKADVKLTRISIALSETTVNKTIDTYLADGYNVQIIANWNNGVNGFRGFAKPSESDNVASKAEAFFAYYAPYKNQIPFISVENEWDWEVVNGSNLQDYLAELSIITSVGHKYGFKIAEGGITSTALQRWTYSQLSGDEQDEWFQDYWVGLNSGYDYDDLMNIINTYIDGAKNIDFDYSNVHWCNPQTCSGGFSTATQTYMKACNKKSVVCNEFYIKTNSLDLFNATVDEIKGNTAFGLAYSGSNNSNKAIELTDAMLEALR